jgi:hypothetical protein
MRLNEVGLRSSGKRLWHDSAKVLAVRNRNEPSGSNLKRVMLCKLYFIGSRRKLRLKMVNISSSANLITAFFDR